MFDQMLFAIGVFSTFSKTLEFVTKKKNIRKDSL